MTVFDPSARTILILEDQKHWQQILSAHSKVAARRLKDRGLFVQLKILLADSIDRALRIISEHGETIDIVSVDINLDVDGSLDDTDPDEVTYGGFGLLEHLQNRAPDNPPVALIVSGEKNVEFPLTAFQTYGVLNYIFKAAQDKDEIYIRSIETVLWYLTARDAISQPLDQIEYIDIERAERAIQQMLDVAPQARIRPNQLPRDLTADIESFRNKYIHPDTGLPLGAWSDAKLKRFIVQAPQWVEYEPPLPLEVDEWTILRCTLHGYDQFIREYASQQEAVLTIFSNEIKSVLKEYDEMLIFVGHLDRNTVQSDVRLFAIFNKAGGDYLQTVKSAIGSNISRAIEQVYPSKALHPEFDASAYSFSVRFKQWLSTGDNVIFDDLHTALDELNRGNDE